MIKGLEVVLKGHNRIQSKGRQTKKKRFFLRFKKPNSLVFEQMENSRLSPTNIFML